MKQVIITILPDGTSSVDAQGFAGKGCATATKELELVLAGNAPGNTTDKKKPDFYATIAGTQTNRN